MKITNKLNLPQPIVEALKNDGYNPGSSDITATGLLEPVRISALKAMYRDELTEDASSLIYSLQGQSIHTILERAAISLKGQGYVAEQRFYIDIPMPDGTTWKVGAQIDVLNTTNGLLQDYKVTSVYSVKDGAKEDYVKQMNIQAHILRKNGYMVNKLQIVAILRDWSKNEYARELVSAKAKGFSSTRYPEYQVAILDVPIVDEEEVELYIIERAIEHKRARALPESELPVCSSEERWERKGMFALMEPGKKRATRLVDTEEAAKVLLSEYPKARIEARPGESIRCASYCPVASKCSIAKKNGWVK